MSTMEAAYELAACAVRQRFAEQQPAYLDVLNAIRAEDIAVYTGDYDSIEEVLIRLAVPFEMDPDAEALSCRIVFMNCSSRHDATLVKQVGAYIETGAWLVTTDWALHNVVEALYPDKVRWSRKQTADEVVAVEPDRNSLWSDVVVLGADPQWWLEASSYPIEVVDKANVMVEAASHDLLRKYDAPVVAVRFPAGQGTVYHVISHLWLKRTRTPGERYSGSCVDFLQAGMRLSEDGIALVLTQAKVQPEDINFASLQSAATATEVVAQLCVRAKSGQSLPFPTNSPLAELLDETRKTGTAVS